MDIMSYLMGQNSAIKKGMKVEVVTELPTTGETNVIYLVPKQDTSDNDIFDEYIWVNNDWELIGSTAIDISGKQDTMQFSTMPTADNTTVGKIIQYVGATTNDYTNGYFYIGINNSGTYGWSNINVQAGSSDSDKLPIYDFYSTINMISSGQTTLSADDRLALSEIINDVYSKGHHSFGINFSYNNNYGSSICFANTDNVGAKLIENKPTTYTFYTLTTQSSDYQSLVFIYTWRLYIRMSWNGNTATVTEATVYRTSGGFISTSNTMAYTPTSNYHPATKKYVDDNKGQTIQYETMPTASADYVGKIVQYTGTTDANYTSGYFYTCTGDGTNYGWDQIDVQPGVESSDIAVCTLVGKNIGEVQVQPNSNGVVGLSTGAYAELTTFLSNNLGKYIILQLIGNNNANCIVYLGYLQTTTGTNIQTFPKYIFFYGYGSYNNSVFYGSTKVMYSYDAATNKYSIGFYVNPLDGNPKLIPDASQVLTKDNTDTYAPSGDYNPATKKYVDDSIATAITTTLGGSF